MNATILQGDCLDVLSTLPDQSVHCCVTSPPYWGLRDYGCQGQLGLEETPEEYVSKMVQAFRQVRRVLRDDGTLWLNLGDSYGSAGGDTYTGFNKRWNGTGGPESKQDNALNGVKSRKPKTGNRPKNLIGIPWRVAFALQADGWYLRQDLIWHKPNAMPESVKDRCTKAHEYVFLLSKQEQYHFDAKLIMQDGVECQKRNRRSVWTISSKPFKGAHFATMPPDLVEPCILAGCPEGGVVLDPFAGSGTVPLVAVDLGRNAIGIELNPEYVQMINQRLDQSANQKKLF